MPYPSEHSCRLNPPGKYSQFARKNCAEKSSGKCIDVIYGIFNKAGYSIPIEVEEWDIETFYNTGDFILFENDIYEILEDNQGEKPNESSSFKKVSERQALRYPIKIWSADDARAHCKTQGGSFEAAEPKKEKHSTEKEPDRFDIAYGIKEGSAGIFENEQHDKGIGIIRGFSVITKGEIKTHDMIADDITLRQVVELGNKSKIGIKSRFGHPAMSSTALGTFLGRVKNFYIDGDRVRADLFFDETAHDTPNGKLAPYLLKLAKTDPEAFGASLTGKKDIEEQKNGNGTPKKDPVTGNILFPLARILKLSTVDVVDDPAANEGMFGISFNKSVQLSKEMTDFLDKFLSQPDAVKKSIQFLQRYQVNKEEEEEETKTITKEEKPMEVKDLTLETLKTERKDLVEVIEAEAGKKAAGLERNRVKYILMELSAFTAGIEKPEIKAAFEAIAKKSIEDGDKEEVALGKFKDEEIKQLKAQSPKTTGGNEDPEKGKKTHLERAQEYQKEKGGNMTDALKATAEPRKKS